MSASVGSVDYWDGYQRGYLDGIAHGREQLEREYAETHGTAAAIARRMAKSDTYAELAERRGEHHRAERQRQVLAARGIASTQGNDDHANAERRGWSA